VKEKTLAAHRAGIKRVILPDRNKADLEEVPQEVRDELEFVPVSRLDEVLAAALERVPQPSQEWVDEMAKQQAAAQANQSN
jgi:ATP-dependent Lon protease